ncbi:MAG: MFS transporter, partial [Mycolicibacterium hassiacum]
VLVLAVAALLEVGAGDLAVLVTALTVNGCGRFVNSGMSAALPHVVPRAQLVPLNSFAIAAGSVASFLGAAFMLVPRQLLGADDAAAASIISLVAVPVAAALWLAWRFAPHALGPGTEAEAGAASAVLAVVTGWVDGARTVASVPTVAATLAGLAAHRAALGINSLLLLVIVRHTDGPQVAGLASAALFTTAVGVGAFLAAAVMPWAVRRWGRYRTANAALAAAALIQLAGAGLRLSVMLVCALLLGLAGQVVKLCADSAMQLDVDDALRGHVFTVQDALFWISFIGAIALAASVVPPDGRPPLLVVAGSAVYLAGLVAHAVLGRRAS